jgi:oligogalacturonide transport system permease protein
MHSDRKIKKILLYAFLILLAFVMIYPLIWLLAGSFKPNDEIFSSVRLLPSRWEGFSSFVNGWKGSGQYTYNTFFLNSFTLVVPTVLFTIFSSTITGYGFARFKFPCKKLLFSLVIATLLLPGEILIVSRYIMFNKFSWINTYMPFIVPAFFGTYSFFIFMMLQFIRGIPKTLDEAAYIDGCSSLQIFAKIILPLCKPAIFCIAIFQFVWRWNDFFEPLIYITSVSKYTVALGLRMALDTEQTVQWNKTLAMSMVSLLPPIFVYLVAQKYFVEGITVTGIKG